MLHRIRKDARIPPLYSLWGCFSHLGLEYGQPWNMGKILVESRSERGCRWRNTQHFIIGAYVCIRPYRNATLSQRQNSFLEERHFACDAALAQDAVLYEHCFEHVCVCLFLQSESACNHLLHIFVNNIACSLPSRGYACLSSPNVAHFKRIVDFLGQLASATLNWPSGDST